MKFQWLVIAGVLLGSMGLSEAHPGSGLAVTEDGKVYFVYTTVGLVRVEADGKLTTIHNSRGGHWMCVDWKGVFANAQPKHFKRVTADGVKPALIFADGGAPIAVCDDGRFYYGSGWEDAHENDPGADTVSRFAPNHEPATFSPELRQKLRDLKEGVGGIAAGSGALFVASQSSIFKVDFSGKVTVVADKVNLADCEADLPPNFPAPGFRGIFVADDGTIYAAATGCRRTIKLDSAGKPTVLLKTEAPWNPTDVAVRGEDLYVLEWTHANGSPDRGWRPRVRQLKSDGAVRILFEAKENIALNR